MIDLRFWKRGKKKASHPLVSQAGQWNLDIPLIYLSGFDADKWTLRDACSGTSIMGRSGAGKTSASGYAIAMAFLRQGMGGLVLTAKNEEWPEVWKPMVEEAGRAGDVIRFAPDESYRFNFLNYELSRPDGGQTENLVALFTKVTEIAEGKQNLSGGDGQFWDRAMRELLRNAIDLLSLAQGSLTVEDIVRLIDEAPTQPEQLDSETWRNKSFCLQCLAKALDREKSPREQHDFDMVKAYWLKRFVSMPDKTRGSIIATFTSIADLLLHGMAWELFCTDTNIVPEVTFQNNKILVIDVPIEKYEEVGRIIQGIFKYMWQRAVLRRNVNEHPACTFLWVDEAQNFLLASEDFKFQSVARSARACTVYLTQNLSNYLAVLGSESEAHSLLGNLGTQIFHNNTNHPTNQFASDLISQHWTTTFNFNSGSNDGMGGNRSAGGSQSVQSKVLPSAFTTLRTGGPPNNLEVDAIIFQGGRIFAASNDTYLFTTFKQKENHKGDEQN